MPRHRSPEPAHKRSEPDTEDTPRLSASRRQVIIGAATAGLTVAAAAGAVEALAGSALAAEPSGSSGRSKEPVVAHVRDVASGHIDIFVGDRQVTIRDRAMAARLAGAAH